jgi:hypothetical protein
MTLQEWEEKRGVPPEQRTPARNVDDDGQSYTDTLADDED